MFDAENPQEAASAAALAATHRPSGREKTGVPHRWRYWCYTLVMPTTLERTTITHTPPVEQLLDVARARWGDEPPRSLLLRLAEAGAKVIAADAHAVRRAALERASRAADTAYGHAYDPEYLNRLRDEWPA